MIRSRTAKKESCFKTGRARDCGSSGFGHKMVEFIENTFKLKRLNWMSVTAVELRLKQLKTVEKAWMCFVSNRAKTMHVLHLRRIQLNWVELNVLQFASSNWKKHLVESTWKDFNDFATKSRIPATRWFWQDFCTKSLLHWAEGAPPPLNAKTCPLPKAKPGGRILGLISFFSVLCNPKCLIFHTLVLCELTHMATEIFHEKNWTSWFHFLHHHLQHHAHKCCSIWQQQWHWHNRMLLLAAGSCWQQQLCSAPRGKMWFGLTCLNCAESSPGLENDPACNCLKCDKSSETWQDNSTDHQNCSETVLRSSWDSFSPIERCRLVDQSLVWQLSHITTLSRQFANGLKTSQNAFRLSWKKRQCLSERKSCMMLAQWIGWGSRNLHSTATHVLSQGFCLCLVKMMCVLAAASDFIPTANPNVQFLSCCLLCDACAGSVMAVHNLCHVARFWNVVMQFCLMLSTHNLSEDFTKKLHQKCHKFCHRDCRYTKLMTLSGNQMNPSNCAAWNQLNSTNPMGHLNHTKKRSDNWFCWRICFIARCLFLSNCFCHTGSLPKKSNFANWISLANKCFALNVCECVKCLQTFCLCQKMSSDISRQLHMSENVFECLICLNKFPTLNRNLVKFQLQLIFEIDSTVIFWSNLKHAFNVFQCRKTSSCVCKSLQWSGNVCDCLSICLNVSKSLKCRKMLLLQLFN